MPKRPRSPSPNRTVKRPRPAPKPASPKKGGKRHTRKRSTRRRMTRRRR